MQYRLYIVYIYKTIKAYHYIIQIDDAVQIRYKPPFPKINDFKGKPIQRNDSLIISDFVVRIAKKGVGFAIIRKVDNTVL